MQKHKQQLLMIDIHQDLQSTFMAAGVVSTLLCLQAISADLIP